MIDYQKRLFGCSCFSPKWLIITKCNTTVSNSKNVSGEMDQEPKSLKNSAEAYRCISGTKKPEDTQNLF